MVIQIVGWLSAATWFLLLLAFAAGVPSTAVANDHPDAAATGDPLVATPPGSGAG